MNPATLASKARNTRNLIHHIIRCEEIARPALAAAMGVSTGTVTNIINELIANGIVYEGRAEGAGLGRKAKLLHFNSGLRYVVTISISEIDRIDMCVCDLLGGVLARKSVHVDLFLTERNPGQAIVSNFSEAVAGFITSQPAEIRKKLVIVAMSVLGLLNKNQTIYAPFYNWRSLPLEKPLQAAINLPVYFQNKIRVEAIYEMRYVDKRDKNVIYMTVTPGVGLASFYDGKLIEGKNGISGEAGHMTVDINGGRCYCGNYGCIEMYCGGNAMLAKGSAMLSGGDRDDILCGLVRDAGGKLTIELMFEALRLGSIKMHMLFAECARYLGVALANITNCYDPDRIITTGSLFEHGDFIYSMALEEARGRIINRFARDVPVSLGRLKAGEPEKAICAAVLDRVLDTIIK